MRVDPDSFLIGRVADTTEQRDRVALDSSIAALLMEFLGAESVCLYRLIEDGHVTRMARRASLKRGASRAEVDNVAELSVLGCTSDQPAWQRCVASRSVVQAEWKGGTHVTLFPIDDRANSIGLLEIVTAQPLPVRETTLVRGVLRILRNQLALLDYGERDTLTGLLNRKTLETRLESLTAALRASANALGTPPDATQFLEKQGWLGVLDIDRFKSINDRHGHLFGDEVLLLVSQIMKQTFRGADELFRFGGEEFVILLEGADVNGAHIAFERLRAAVEARVFPQSCVVTVSIGYTRIGSNDIPTTCIERADAALYYAKRNGRNKSRQYEKLVESGLLAEAHKEGEVELF